ncbi:hypothetical protein N7474_000897 [Penicillium riverlandense]|uniref:uncharacterized protein n=1 Tax=Penicillium riverlandense TaxID=1903569 RepID=UPI00254963D6|nr:uncharacterized protein N7474_000897 [Penicillium riverlandense]KAJ5832586.1 hypothetical protein N7474_000897 [Penicillium riverlandense]
METISNVVHKASTAIWGEDNSSHQEQSVEPHGDEPMSGVQGKGAVNDPFDAGNREDQSDNADSIDEPTPTEDSPAAQKTTTEPSSKNNTDPITTGQPMSSSTEAGGGGGSSSTNEKQPTDGGEQRSTEKSGAESSHPLSAMDDPNLKVSEEALKGPQGPAPHSASEFEKEMDGKAPSDTGIASKTSGTSEGKENGQKHGTMSRMKERLNKVTHLHHSSK